MSSCPTTHCTVALSVAFTAVLGTAMASNSLGPDWDGDSQEDAGNKPQTAQKVILETTDTLVRISGKLKGEDKSGGLAGEELGDYQDMYAIVVKEPGQFSISTLGPLGMATFDSLLTVYDFNGEPLLGNDDADNGVSGSFVGSCTSDGQLFCIEQPGTMYIAISGADSKPIASNGESAFAWTADKLGVVGSAGNGPITDWTFPGETGEYVITLQAIGPIPPECGAENTRSCFEIHAAPYCSTPGCCEAVCSIDPFCCKVTWDANCVEMANLFCGNEDSLLHCGHNNAGSCSVTHANPFCEDPVCCATVCAIRPLCCDTTWDQACANIAEKLCVAPCNQECPPDLNFDTQITGADLAILLGHWNQSGCTDLDGNGTTDGADITILLAKWGDSCFD